MKNLIIIFTLIFITACGIHKGKNNNTDNHKLSPYKRLEKFNGDTLAFVQTSILDRKTFYIDKPLKTFLEDLQIPIKKFHNHTTPINKFIYTALTIDIYNNVQQEAKLTNKEDPIHIIVVWKTPLSSKTTDSLIRNSHLNWTPEVAEYYGKQIISDVVITKYNFKK